MAKLTLEFQDENPARVFAEFKRALELYAAVNPPEEICHARGAMGPACGSRDAVPERLLCEDARAATCVDCLRSEIGSLREDRENQAPSHHFVRVDPSQNPDHKTICGIPTTTSGMFFIVFQPAGGPGKDDVRRCNCLACFRGFVRP
jgi:hypothetical protein